MTKLLLSIPDAAKALSCGRSMVYGLMDEGAIQSVKIGRRRLISAESIERYVATLLAAAA
ncbi:MAG: helix-turn-helix domain-containing protein [Sphingomonas sp.]|uniref:helix-turn-helix domain-containing protein n=1 Tax=Sphingomonas sp. TaxID=28214 RepID=UPI0025EFB78C|nr:helix-turn-helix domain-containing protein [Sphingomonas sp.]MBQ1499565.1 helix-turn-helix domain-containing protein [Sphingomonas sp.]MBQ8105689.1 helix-turn-helix domain-containing protein [Afipia sp.]MBR2789570.1 helix-turn-helix domain-containing protein [Eggerthellaceae bacterium]